MNTPIAVTKPLVPSNVDLRNFSHTPIFRSRLFGSEFHTRSSDKGWRVGVTLWLKSWDQVPAGSLPDNDIDLCYLAELGRDMRTWKKIKHEALHGWVLCSDGRLYHPVVAEGVNEAWRLKEKRRKQTEAARNARRENSATCSVTETETKPVTETVLSNQFYSNLDPVLNSDSWPSAEEKNHSAPTSQDRGSWADDDFDNPFADDDGVVVPMKREAR